MLETNDQRLVPLSVGAMDTVDQHPSDYLCDS